MLRYWGFIRKMWFALLIIWVIGFILLYVFLAGTTIGDILSFGFGVFAGYVSGLFLAHRAIRKENENATSTTET